MPWNNSVYRWSESVNTIYPAANEWGDRPQVCGIQNERYMHDGVYCDVLQYAIPQFDDRGGVTGFIGSCVEVTMQKQAVLQARSSLAILDTLVNAAPIGLALIDRDLRYVRINETLATINGIPADQAVGQRVGKIVPGFAAIIESLCRQVVDTGNAMLAVEAEGETQSAPGKRRYWTASYYPVRLDGETLGVGVVVVETTERKLAERERVELLAREATARQQAQRWLDALLHMLPVPVVLIEPGTARVFFANKAADHLAGGIFPKAQSAEQYGQYYHCTDAAGNRLPDDQMPGILAARGKRLSGLEVEWHTPARKRTLLVSSSALPAMHGHAATTVMAFDDVTQLKEAISARDAFLSVASHELRTPLAALQVQVEALVRSIRRHSGSVISKEPLLDNLVLVERQALRLETLINEILNVSSITSGTFELRPEQLDLAELVTEVVERFRSQGADADIEIHLRTTSCIGKWDPSKLDHVVTNLLSNALKYSAGKPIDVGVERIQSMATLTVRDRGVGIPTEDQARIFERFERVASQNQHYGGLGLGLWVVRQLVDAFRGTVRIESEPGQGATFTIQLPTSGASDSR